MSAAPPFIQLTLREMREAFDHGFAQQVGQRRQSWQDFLLVKLGQLPHALPMAEVAALQRALPEGVTPVPGPLTALMGIAGHKGRILPVYDLAALLGLSPAKQPQWQIVTLNPPVILAIDAFERHVRGDGDVIARLSTPDEATQGHIRAHLHTDGEQRPIVSLASVLDTIRTMSQTARQER